MIAEFLTISRPLFKKRAVLPISELDATTGK
jgi:hypothetical protein